MIFRLSDEQWSLVAPVLVRSSHLETRGRKRRSDRFIFDAVLWVIQSNSPWRNLRYQGFPPYQTCFRRFEEWVEGGALISAITLLAYDMEKRGHIALKDCFFDNVFAVAGDCMPILFVGETFIGDESEHDWNLNTKRLFESGPIWRLLLSSPSPWIQKQLPLDLYQRSYRI